MRYHDPKRSYKTRKDRLRLPDSNKYRTLEYDDRTSEIDSDIRSLVMNVNVHLNMKNQKIKI